MTGHDDGAGAASIASDQAPESASVASVEHLPLHTRQGGRHSYACTCGWEGDPWFDTRAVALAYFRSHKDWERAKGTDPALADAWGE